MNRIGLGCSGMARRNEESSIRTVDTALVSEDDFAVSYDAYFYKVVFEAPGRRSKKREQQFMEIIQEEADSLADEANGKIFWDKPLIEARRG